MARRRRPLRAVSLVFVGFVTLAVLSQLSSHFFASAIPKHLLSKNEAVLASIQRTSTELALGASGLALVFACAVLVITRARVSSDLDVYRAAGLPSSSAFLRLVSSQSLVPLGWVAAAAAGASLVDFSFGLDAAIPIGLGLSFVALVVAWLAFLTLASFSQRAVQESPEGRAG